ncbi:MAG: DUF1275 domain-containing protein [Oscillospiraceae bacterium]|nr:DUF1275 domain-containing protein [Oscillospiraceae bacterium]
MDNANKRTAAAEALPLGIILALSGGLLDAYTYLIRGGVFSSMQTGNMLQVALKLMQGEPLRALHYIPPILAFAMGIWAAEAAISAWKGRGDIPWRQLTLGVEILLVTVTAFLPESMELLANMLVAFVSAVQVESFRKVEGNPFASTMCTGNLRSGSEQLFRYWETRDKKALSSAGCYFIVIAAFIASAAAGVPLCAALGQKACLVCAGILLVSLCVLTLTGKKQAETAA